MGGCSWKALTASMVSELGSRGDGVGGVWSGCVEWSRWVDGGWMAGVCYRSRRLRKAAWFHLINAHFNIILMFL